MFPNELLSRLIRALGDPARRAITTIDQQDRFIHDGDAYYTEISLTIAAGATAYTIATVGNIPICMKSRFVQTVSTATVDITTELYEGVTSSGTGVEIPVFNLNRNSDNITTFSHVTGQTATGGTKLPSTQRLYSENKSSNSVIENIEYQMKINTKYAVKITNNGTQEATILIRWYFYEIEYK